MTSVPQITTVIRFLSPEQLGRERRFSASPIYRPHVVVGDPSRRTATLDARGFGDEHYLGVQFTGDGRELLTGTDHTVTMDLLYHPGVDYSELVPGATFTIREGPVVVGFGRVIARDA